MKFGVDNANHLENFLLIHNSQVAEFDCLDQSDVEKINEDMVVSWQQIIYHSGELQEERVTHNV